METYQVEFPDQGGYSDNKDACHATQLLIFMSIRSEDGNRSVFPTPAPFCRRLQLVVREEEKGDNLFVRLSPAIALDLCSLARKHHRNDLLSTSQNRSGETWSIFDGKQSACISFLPLCVSFGDGVTIFVSYNGGTCVSSSKEGR